MDSLDTFLKTVDDQPQATLELLKEVADQLIGLRDDIERLRRENVQQANLINRLQNELIRAGRYENEDPRKHIQGIQVLLTRAGEVKGRDKGRRR